MKMPLHDDINVDVLRLDKAWTWLCDSRKAPHANADIRDLLYRWSAYREMCLNQVRSGTYRLTQTVRWLYQQARFWTKTRQANSTSDYCTWWKIWTAALILGLSCYGTRVQAKVVATIPISGTVTTGTQSNPGYAVNGQVNCTVGAVSTSKSSLSGSSLSPNNIGLEFSTSSDGQATGIELDDDVILMLSGTMSGKSLLGISPNTTLMNYTTTWNSLGIPSPTNGGMLSPWCYSIMTSEYSIRESQQTTITGSAIVYAGPRSTATSVTVPSLWLGRRIATSDFPGALGPVQISNSMVVPIIRTECTISPQDTIINFGTVLQSDSDNKVLGYFQSALNINCPTIVSNNGTETMTISFSGAQGRYTDTLALVGTEGQGQLAEVRGNMGTGTGMCDNNPDRIQFQGQKYSIGNIGTGLTQVPLTWSLCSNATGLTGVGAAQATVTLNWP